MRISRLSIFFDFFRMSVNSYLHLLLCFWGEIMFKGKQSHSKLEIIIYILERLLIDGYCNPKYVIAKFNISNQTMIRYIATIKNTLIDFGIYYLEIFYDRNKNIYICHKNI